MSHTVHEESVYRLPAVDITTSSSATVVWLGTFNIDKFSSMVIIGHNGGPYPVKHGM